VILINLENTRRGGPEGEKVVGINQVVWDPATSTLYAKSDELLDQHTRYGLIVTRGVRDETRHQRHSSAFDTTSTLETRRSETTGRRSSKP